MNRSSLFLLICSIIFGGIFAGVCEDGYIANCSSALDGASDWKELYRTTTILQVRLCPGH